MAVADKIRQMSTAKELERVAEDVLPHFEKFLESPEEKRLRRIRSGIITAAIGLGASIILLVMAIDKPDILPYITPALITFLVGIGVIVNGLIFTVPRKSLPGDAYDALSQKVLDSGSNMNRIPYDAPAASSLPAGANLTNELAPTQRSQPSITEHTTHHLNTSKH